MNVAFDPRSFKYLGDYTSSHSLSALADGKAQSLGENGRVYQLDGECRIVAGHDLRYKETRPSASLRNPWTSNGRLQPQHQRLHTERE